jgi:hypothetical protein
MTEPSDVAQRDGGLSTPLLALIGLLACGLLLPAQPIYL